MAPRSKAASNRRVPRGRPSPGPLQTQKWPSGRTALGHAGYRRDIYTDLFLLGVTNFVSEETHHEGAGHRDDRFNAMVREIALDTPEWLGGFLPWLRRAGNLRTAPLTGACHALHARWLASKDGSRRAAGRRLLSDCLGRADEPGRAWSYWTQTFSEAPPISFQRGISDAIVRLYTERALLAWDSDEAAFRFGDIVELARPRTNSNVHGTWHNDLFEYAILRRHGRDTDRAVAHLLERLPTIAQARRIFAMPRRERRAFLVSPGGAEAIQAAGIRWQHVAGWLQGRMDAEAWEACIPSMGYMALLRNLRNFDQAGISMQAAEAVEQRLVSRDEIAQARQFPFRYWSAWRAVKDSLRWGSALEKALTISLDSVPALPGRTLILVDRSPSMWDCKISEKSDVDWADAAAMFGSSLALHAQHADLVEFWAFSKEVRFRRGDAVLQVMTRFSHSPAPGGTDIPRAVKLHFRPGYHDRVVIITDEQTKAGMLPSNMYGYHGYGPEYRDTMRPTEIDQLIPKSVPVYMWNFGGYTMSAVPTGVTRHLLSGLNDSAFTQLATLERGLDGGWPWEADDQQVNPHERREMMD